MFRFKIIALITSICFLFNSVCFAECDFSTGIKPTDDGHYNYTKDCHIRVGELVQSDKTKDEQVKKLFEANTLKDLALEKADERTQLWRDTSLKLNDNIQRMNDIKKDEFWISFGLGVVTTFAAGMAAASLTNRH